MVNNDFATAEHGLLTNMEITFCPGKGNKLVDIIVTKECIAALNILTDDVVWDRAGVSTSNPFIFAWTEQSSTHCGGWDARKYVASKANIDCPELTATGQRVKLSTSYASLDVEDKDRELFYKHMGHTASVYKGKYQRPLALQTLEKIGPVLLYEDERLAEGLFGYIILCKLYKNTVLKHICPLFMIYLLIASGAGKK